MIMMSLPVWIETPPPPPGTEIYNSPDRDLHPYRNQRGGRFSGAHPTEMHSCFVFFFFWSIGVFPKWEKFSLNSVNQINHWSMNWAEFKDPVPHICCAGAVVACWSLTQEVAGFESFCCNDNFLSLNSANSLKTFRKNSNVSFACCVCSWTVCSGGGIDRCLSEGCLPGRWCALPRDGYCRGQYASYSNAYLL